MVKNKKPLLILVISLVLIYLAISIIFIIPKEKKYDHTVFIGSNTKINIINGKISIKNDNVELKKQNVKVYFKKKFIDSYIISKSGDTTGVAYSVYNNEGNFLLPDSVLIAHTPDISIGVKEDSLKESTDIDKISNFIETSDIGLSSYELDYLNINTLDIDDDGTKENIYSVGLIKYDDEEYSEEEIDEEIDDDEYEMETQEYISFVYLEKDGKYALIDKVESEGNPVSSIKLSFAKLIDFNNDGNYEFVIEKMMSEYGPYYYELYNYGTNKFTKIGGE